MSTTRYTRGTSKNNTDKKNNKTTKNKTKSSSSKEKTSKFFPYFKDKKYGEGFSPNDYEFLAVENKTYRFQPNSKKGIVGHAVITTNESGDKIAYQYQIPTKQDGEGPKVVPLTHIEEITPYGMTRYKAKAPDGTTMYAKRYVHAKLGSQSQEKDIDIGYFSPSEKEGKEPFWGDRNDDEISVFGEDKNELSLFRHDLSEELREELESELKEIPTIVKGGNDLIVHTESVRKRDLNSKRGKTQNTIMKGSAHDAFEEFLNKYTDELSPKFKEVLKRSIGAELRNAFYSNYYPEWLHAEGFSLTPINKDPQRKDNLAAAPKWTNTEMMVLECLAKWYALNRPEAYVQIKPHFEMLLDTEIVKYIKFEVTVKEKENWVKFLQEINPFKKYPVFRKASDIAQGAGIAYHLLNNTSPASEQKILKAIDTIQTTSSIQPLLSNHSTPVNSVNNNSKSNSPHAGTTGNIFASLAKNNRPDDQVSFPTDIKHERSIVQLLTTARKYNFNAPWKPAHPQSWSGSGLVIERGGKKYILTNAHCVENAVIIRVRLANNHMKKYKAKPKCISYQCDLALLEVDNPEFNQLVEPVELGDMVKIEQTVKTVGFPMGGDEISTSEGIVSRIEVQDYAESGCDMLQVQIDAAVNHGNSGGPVFSGDKVVGVAFQGIDGYQGLGYMIPIPIIKHFLTEAFSNKPYRGFPVLPVSFDALENDEERKYYGMTQNQTGMRISRIDKLGDAANKLKRNDILLEIDGMRVTNEGFVSIPDIGKSIDFLHVTHMKYVGDSVQLKVLRKNPETSQAEIHDLSVVLDHVPLETEIVSQTVFDKAPSYYIVSGLSFTPFTRNYLEANPELDDVFVMEQSCRLSDLPKKSEDEEYVVINEVFDCDATYGYSQYINTFVKSVNDKPIKNMRELVAAFESNKEPIHRIVTTANDTIIIKNMPKEELDAILADYSISHHCSKDFLPKQLDANNAMVVDHSVNHPVQQVHVMPLQSAASSSKKTQQEKSHSKPKVAEHKKDRMELESEQDNDITLTAFTGHKKYMATVNKLEERYKNFPSEQDVEVDDEFAKEFLGEESEEELPYSPDNGNTSDQEHDKSLSSSGESEEISDEEISDNEKSKSQFSNEGKQEESTSEEDKLLVKNRAVGLSRVPNRNRLFQVPKQDHKTHKHGYESNSDLEERQVKRQKI